MNELIDSTLSVLDLGNVILETEEIEIDRKKKASYTFACSSLTYDIGINQVPTAMVVIGVGNLLGMWKKVSTPIEESNNAEDLMNIASAVGSDKKGYVKCTIYIIPRNGKEKKAIFKGRIIGASLLFKTGTPTVRAVRLECMNDACMLYAQPLAAYRLAAGADIVTDILSNTAYAPTEGQAAAKIGMLRMSSLTASDVCEKLGNTIIKADIATRLAKMIDAIVIMTSHTFNTVEPEEFGNLLGVMDYIKSDYTLNPDITGQGTITEDSFNLALCTALMNHLRQESILDSILSVLTSPEFMLSVVPTFGGDFKLEIAPYRAWDTSKEQTQDILFSEISELNAIYRPIEHLNDPEICVVDYSDSLNFGGVTEMTGEPSGMLGVYSTNEDAKQLVEDRLNANIKSSKMILDTSNYKYKIYKAPMWMNFAYINSKDRTSKKIKEQIEKQRIKENATSRRPFAGVEYDYKLGIELANKLAETMYIIKHGESNTSTLRISPRLIFGTDKNRVLESHIGKVINVLPSKDNKSKEDMKLAIRGMLTSIHFTYNAGASASCSYDIALTRVRRYNEKEEPIVCQIYTEEKK